MKPQLNDNIAKALDMDISEEEEDIVEDDSDKENTAIVVQPHEIVPVINGDLPQMEDIERRLIDGENQLESVIKSSLSKNKEIEKMIPETEPRFRNRMIEHSNISLQIALDAIKHKTKLQMDKKEARMKEDSYRKPGVQSSDGGSGNVTNFFVGNREELMSMFDSKDSNGS